MTTLKKSAISDARTTVRLPEMLHRRAKLAAAWSGTKLQEFIAAAVEEHLVRIETEMQSAHPAPRHRTTRKLPDGRV